MCIGDDNKKVKYYKIKKMATAVNAVRLFKSVDRARSLAAKSLSGRYRRRYQAKPDQAQRSRLRSAGSGVKFNYARSESTGNPVYIL
jgi:hypothetical protein